jgi:glycosyltransferase involved in cell wall biosynthesis
VKVHILFPFQDGPFGGANQFLKALRAYLISSTIYTDSIVDAHVVIFNLNPSYALFSLLKEIEKVKSVMPEKLIITRIDGPVHLYRGKDLLLDKAFFMFNRLLADGTVFQSSWSRKECLSLGMKRIDFEEVISNAPDQSIFNSKGKDRFRYNGKIRLIATSWSANWKKGFVTYKWLDQNLDFSRYEMILVGNSPTTFRNIHHIPPLESSALASKLRKSDIFITASEKDPCSNSLIEALHCGLPAIGRRDGGHPELIKQAGELFDKAQEIPPLLEKIVSRYEHYQEMINVPSMKEIGSSYHAFITAIHQNVKGGQYKPKKLHIISCLRFKVLLLCWYILERVRSKVQQYSCRLFS